MKRISNLLLFILVSGTILAPGLFAMSVEETYIASYRGRTDIPVPIAVVRPEVDWKHASGVVQMKFVVDEAGLPRDITPVGDVDEELAAIIAAALRDWKFNPALVDGKPVAKKVAIPFVIHGDAVTNVRLVAAE